MGWKWIVTGDRPSKLHFTGNPGIKPAIIHNLPPEPNPLEVFQLMVHDSLWDEIATETNRFDVQFYEKNPNSPTISQWFPTTSHEIKAYCALCVFMSQVKLDMRVPSVWWRYMFQTILGCITPQKTYK